jgi:hypothetical protein
LGNDKATKAYNEALNKTKANYFDSLVSEVENIVKDTSWTTEELTKVIGNTDWIDGGAFEFNIETGEWEAASAGALSTLREFVKAKYGQAYADMLPTWEELEKIKEFNVSKKTSEKVDLIKGLSPDFSLDDLEKLIEAEMLTYQEATAIWSSDNPWETLLNTIKLSS